MRIFGRDRGTAAKAQGTDAEERLGRALGEQAEMFVRIMADMAPGVRLDFGPESLGALDGFIAATFDGPGHPPAPDSLQADVGAYLGETIRRRAGGRWSERGTLIGLGGDVGEVNPIGRARKRFANGPQDSLAWFYEIVLQHAGAVGSQPRG